MMLVGLDSQGYIKKSAVPPEIRGEPERWYDPADDVQILDRAPFYIDAGNTPMLVTEKLPGRFDEGFFDSWGPPGTPLWELPVIVDGFDYPLLYYVANKHGRPTNMVADVHEPDNDYSGGDQERGVPYYFHEDNAAFTGAETGDDTGEGWDFNGPHSITKSGAMLTADQLLEDDNRNTFARYVIDRKIYRDLSHRESINPATPLRPANADSYLLISPGPDGQYGTADDVNNMPPFEE